MSKKHWLWIHAYLSIFFLPFVLLYIITGVVAIFELEHKWEGESQFIEIDKIPQKGEELAYITEILKAHNLPIPNTQEVQIWESGAVAIGDLLYKIVAYGAFDKDTKVPYYRLMVLKRNLFGIMLALHVSQKTPYYDILAICFSISLLMFYFSGLVMTKFAKGKRLLSLSIFVFGILSIIFSALPSL